MKVNRGFLPAFLLACTVAIDAHADPVQITSGFLESIGLFDTADFEFVGADFFVQGGAEPGVIGPELTCFPCTAGDTIVLNTNYGGTIGSGTATVAGTSYQQVTFTGGLMFQSASITAPLVAGDFTVTQPFTFSGNLLGFLNYNTPNEQMVINELLTGHGVTTAAFTQTPGQQTPLFSFQSVRYDFTSDAAVPEPATLLLFGSGLGAAYLRKRLGNNSK
jgi:hypothetical protein